MGMLDMFNYEKKLRKIKEEHFGRVADLEDKIHQAKLDNEHLRIKQETEIKELEHRFKLDIQELVSKHKKEIDIANHSLKLEKELWETEKEKLNTKHERELNRAKLESEKEAFAKLSQLVEREGLSKETVVKAQAEILKMLKDTLPSRVWKKQEGSPIISIEDKRGGKKSKSKRKK